MSKVPNPLTLQPLNDLVLIQLDDEDAETTTPSGIVLGAHLHGDGTVVGTVLAVGPGRQTESGTRIPVGVLMTQRVCFERHSSVPATVGGRQALVDGLKLVWVRGNLLQAIVLDQSTPKDQVGPALEDWQCRLIDERKQLAERLAGLIKFLESPAAMLNVRAQVRALMEDQRDAMRQYLLSLEERMKLLLPANVANEVIEPYWPDRSTDKPEELPST